MHVQQQSLNICNTAIVGNHYDTSNKNKNIQRSIINKSTKFNSRNHRLFKYHIWLELFPELKSSLFSSFVFHFCQAKHHSKEEQCLSLLAKLNFPTFYLIAVCCNQNFHLFGFKLRLSYQFYVSVIFRDFK
jgi:hypothetical protein